MVLEVVDGDRSAFLQRGSEPVGLAVGFDTSACLPASDPDVPSVLSDIPVEVAVVHTRATGGFSGSDEVLALRVEDEVCKASRG